MRKTFVVGRLNRGSAKIVMLSSGTGPSTPPARALSALLLARARTATA